MLNLILISVLHSNQSTNHVLLYKRTLRTDEASGMEILALLVQFFIETTPHILRLIITVSMAPLLILLHMSYEQSGFPHHLLYLPLTMLLVAFSQLR